MLTGNVPGLALGLNVFMATVIFADSDYGNSRETLLFAPTIEVINEKISKVRETLDKKGLKFVSSIVEEMKDVKFSQGQDLFIDDFSVDGKIVH